MLTFVQSFSYATIQVLSFKIFFFFLTLLKSISIENRENKILGTLDVHIPLTIPTTYHDVYRENYLRSKFLLLGLCMSSTVFAAKKQISSADVPAGVAAYSQAVLLTSKSNDQTLYISGILPRLQSNELVEDPAQAMTLVMDHVAALLKEAAMSWNDVVDVIILVRDINDFKVISDSYGLYLKNQNVDILPVRACFQAGKLPLNAVVEIKATADRIA